MARALVCLRVHYVLLADLQMTRGSVILANAETVVLAGSPLLAHPRVLFAHLAPTRVRQLCRLAFVWPVLVAQLRQAVQLAAHLLQYA